VADALKLLLDVSRGGDIAVGEMAEVELHPRTQAPLNRHLVDGDGALAAIHGRSEMPGRVEMGAAMSGQPDPLDCPALAVGKVLLAQAGEEFAHVGRGLLVVAVFDAGAITGRVSGHVVFERNG
jgi:hypothetical protein